MQMGNDARSVALARLEPLIGNWRMEASFPMAAPVPAAGADDSAACALFEWALGGQFVVQRATAPTPAPDSLAIIRFDPGSASYSQHYFDSRGVVRVYAMTFDDRVWTLLRNSPDFSPLDFAQRFTGTFSDDDRSIVGRWESSQDGSTWEHDFDLTYWKVT